MFYWIIAGAFALLGISLHARRLPAQNLSAIALLVLVLSGILEAGSALWNVPYRRLFPGEYQWTLPMGWVGVLLISRRLAQLLLVSKSAEANYGLRVLSFTVVGSMLIWTLIVVLLDRFTVWGILARGVAALVILLAVFPFFIVKHPGARGYRG